MTNIFKYLFLLLSIAFSITYLNAAKVQFSSTKITAADTLKIIFESTDKPLRDIHVLTDAFEIISQATSSNITINNGNVEKKKNLIYTLVPLKAGKHTINLIIDGDKYGPFIVEVANVRANNNSNTSPNIEIAYKKLHNQPLYINEVAPIYTVITYAEEPLSKDFIKRPSHSGLFLQEVPLTQPVPLVDGKNNLGQTIVSRTIAAHLIYPFVAGKHTITGGVARVRIKDNNNFSLFYRKTSKRIDIKPVTIDAIDFPKEGMPKSFNGNYGTFTVSTASDNTTYLSSPLGISVKVTGTGNFDALAMPKPKPNPHYTITEGRLTNAYQVSPKNFVGYKEQTFYLSFDKGGSFNIPPLNFSSFHRDSGYLETNVVFSEIIITENINNQDSKKTILPEVAIDATSNFLSTDSFALDTPITKLLLIQLSTSTAFTIIFALFFLVILQQKKKAATQLNPLNTLNTFLLNLQASLIGEKENIKKEALFITLKQLKQALEGYIITEHSKFFRFKKNASFPMKKFSNHFSVNTPPTFRLLTSILQEKLITLESLNNSNKENIAKNLNLTAEEITNTKENNKITTKKIHHDLSILEIINNYNSLFFATNKITTTATKYTERKQAQIMPSSITTLQEIKKLLQLQKEIAQLIFKKLQNKKLLPIKK